MDNSIFSTGRTKNVKPYGTTDCSYLEAEERTRFAFRLRAERVEANKMYTQPVQLNDVIYNAAEQSFEALVTVYEDGNMRKYACAIDAPIEMSFADAAAGLRKQAMRRHKQRGGMYSEVTRHNPSQRAGRKGFDALHWIESLVHLPGRRAA
jgi:hypothetical protein